MCSFPLSLNFGGYEASVLEEAILPGPVELHMEVTKRKQLGDGKETLVSRVISGSLIQVMPGVDHGLLSYKN